VAQLYKRSVNEKRPEPEAVQASELRKIEVETTFTWAEHMERAAELGGSLPTKLDLVVNRVAAGPVDAWIPVARDDGQEGDWVQIGDQNPHPIYISHLDCFGKARWGSNNEKAHWRPAYFYLKSAHAQPSRL